MAQGCSLHQLQLAHLGSPCASLDPRTASQSCSFPLRGSPASLGPCSCAQAPEGALGGHSALCALPAGAVASTVVKQKLAEVILKKQQAALERTNPNPSAMPYRYSQGHPSGLPWAGPPKVPACPGTDLAVPLLQLGPVPGAGGGGSCHAGLAPLLPTPPAPKSAASFVPEPAAGSLLQGLVALPGQTSLGPCQEGTQAGRAAPGCQQGKIFTRLPPSAP